MGCSNLGGIFAVLHGISGVDGAKISALKISKVVLIKLFLKIFLRTGNDMV